MLPARRPPRCVLYLSFAVIDLVLTVEPLYLPTLYSSHTSDSTLANHEYGDIEPYLVKQTSMYVTLSFSRREDSFTILTALVFRRDSFRDRKNEKRVEQHRPRPARMSLPCFIPAYTIRSKGSSTLGDTYLVTARSLSQTILSRVTSIHQQNPSRQI